jgi:hypothetical protein
MKKFLPFILIFLVIFAGYILLRNKKGELPKEKAVSDVVNQKKQEVVEGIKEMVLKNISLKCTYEIPDGGKVISFVKGKNKIRSTVEVNGKKTETIFIDGKIYSWDNKTKQGMTMTIKNLPQPTPGQKITVENPENYIEQLEKMKANCKQESFSDSLFQPPTDVKFQDLDKLQEMMQGGNFQEMMKQIPTNNEE